ncbi:hypothetical protein, partial [Escherichia coli]|uniref:hypothetical protein n=1 Tax=Escherichia coli TaxID=562 RepID=UPI001B8CB1AE
MKNKVLAFCVKTFFMGAGYKKGRRLLPLRPVSGAYCHHGSLTPVFTLLPVTPPARPVSGAYCHHGSLTPVFTLLPVTPP